MVSSAICIIDGIPGNLKIIEPNSASLTWISLFVFEKSVFARVKFERRSKKMETKVEDLVKDWNGFMRSLLS